MMTYRFSRFYRLQSGLKQVPEHEDTPTMAPFDSAFSKGREDILSIEIPFQYKPA